MNATLTERKPVEITFREEYEGGLVVYTCQSQTRMNKFYYTRILNGKADGCTCPSRVKCYHAFGCEEAERTRATDLQQHLQDAPHSCIYCGRPMKHDGVCGGCQ